MQTKAIIFDYDGTLTRAKKGYSSWRSVWEAIGRGDERKIHAKRYFSNEYTYEKWLYVCFEIFKENGVSRSLFERLAGESVLINKLEETLKCLTNQGIKLYILSGGIKNIIDINLDGLTKYFTAIIGNEFCYDNNDVINSVVPTMFNLGNKDEYVKYVAESQKLDPKDILFVGNGSNDETVKQIGVRTLCLNADDADYLNTKYWDNFLFTDDFSEILKYI